MDELEVFASALEISSPQDRAKFLAEACGDNTACQRRIETLIQSWHNAGDFLTSPPLNLTQLLDGQLPAAGENRDSAAVVGTLGDFRLRREIGRGGMGVVYEAEQISLGRRMALKVLPFFDALNPRQLLRFHNESRAAASLKHPNIVGVHSVGHERGLHYYAMDYIDGRTLSDVIKQLQIASGVATSDARPSADTMPHHPPLDAESPATAPNTPTGVSTRTSDHTQEFLRTVAEWGAQAAAGLDHAHALGIVHRDIKPSNLMVDANGHLWITDFGLAVSDTTTGLTMTGDLLGTLRYMSPEQTSGERSLLDGRTDIYSLGVTLYELVTLQPAFPGDNLQEMLRKISEIDPPSPRQLNRSVPRDLETIILKAMAKEPQARYSTSGQLADDLRRFLGDEPIAAQRPSLWERTGRWARHHRPLVWSSAGSAIVVMMALLVSILLVANAYQRERTQRDIAERNATRADENAARAQTNYETARQAVKQMLTRVADDELARIPEMQTVRRRLLEDAAAYYTELLTRSPRDALAYYERGQVYELLGDYDEVRADYERSIELDPDNAAFHHALGRFCSDCPDLRFRDLDCARLHLQWASRLDPQNLVYHHGLAAIYDRLNETDKAMNEIRQTVELADSKAARMMLEAAAARMNADLRGSLEWEHRALTLAPESLAVHEHLADLYGRLGEYDQAIAAATKCLELASRVRHETSDSRAFIYYLARADALTHLRRYREALADYDKAVELAPFRSYTYKHRAVAHFHLQEYDAALADIAQAVELKPDDVSNVSWIPAQLVAQCPDEHFRQGMFDLTDKTVQQTGQNVEAYCTRARLHATLGRWEEARSDFDLVRPLQPTFRTCPRPAEHAAAYVIHFGLLQGDQGRWLRALEQLRQHVRSDARITPAWLDWVSRWLPAIASGTDHLPGVVFVSDMPWVRSSFGRVVTLGYSPPSAVRETDHGWGDGTTPVAQLPYSRGVVNHAFPDQRPADVVVDVAGRDFTTFKASVGPCEDGSVRFQVLVDGTVKCETPVLQLGDAQPISADVAGAREIVLRVLNGGDTHSSKSAGWGYARFLEAGAEDPLEVPPADIDNAIHADAAFLLAEVHWRQGQQELARRWYDSGAAWTENHPRDDVTLCRRRTEAAGLLGIEAAVGKIEDTQQREQEDK